MNESTPKVSSRISAVYCTVEIQILDEDGDEKGRGMMHRGEQPLTVALFAADLKRVPGLMEILAAKGVKVV